VVAVQQNAFSLGLTATHVSDTLSTRGIDTPMSEDEAEIRALVAAWHRGTQAGDTAAVLALMTDDVVFLVAGRPPMDKTEFEALSTSAPGTPRPKFSATQEIHEIQVSGSLAFLRSTLTIRRESAEADRAIERHGSTLTVFKRVDGRWLLARDANLLAVRDVGREA
jgi:uncharacterized protein (TIGR02246 family)